MTVRLARPNKSCATSPADAKMQVHDVGLEARRPANSAGLIGVEARWSIAPALTSRTPLTFSTTAYGAGIGDERRDVMAGGLASASTLIDSRSRPRREIVLVNVQDAVGVIGLRI